MATEACITKKPQGLGLFERHLTVWVLLCIAGGIVLGKVAPGAARSLDGLALVVNRAIATTVMLFGLSTG